MVPIRARPGQLPAEINEIVGDDPEPHPALHSIVAGISAPVEAMSTLAHADATFAPSAPSLAAAEPALLLFAPAVGAFGGAIGDANSFDASGLCRDLVLGRVEAGISGEQVWYASQHCRVHLDRRDQQIRIIGSLSIHFIVDDDLVLRLLQLRLCSSRVAERAVRQGRYLAAITGLTRSRSSRF